MNVLIRYLVLVTAGGISFDFQTPAVKGKVQEPRHKLRPEAAPISFAAAPGKADPFFAIGRLQETRTPEVYRSCPDPRARNDILHNREWINFAGLYSRKKSTIPETTVSIVPPEQRASVRSSLARIFRHGWNLSPIGRDGHILPGKLIELDRAIARMLESCQAGLEGFHILNENVQFLCRDSRRGRDARLAVRN